MPARPEILPVEAARRWLLHQQGLTGSPPSDATPEALQSLVERLGFVQLDSINVVERAQHLTLFSRLPGYTPQMLDAQLGNRLLFEHWTHDASAIPVRFYPQWKLRFRAEVKRIRAQAWWRERLGARPQALLREVLARIRSEGPLRSADFEHDGPRGAAGWWQWKPQKSALEYLWRTGVLAIARRVHFHKIYDLAERVFPEATAQKEPSLQDHAQWACEGALERLGFATPTELAAYWRLISLPLAKRWSTRVLARGEVVPVRVGSVLGDKSSLALAPADWRERIEKLEPAPSGMRFLSPFDPVLRDRGRALRLFGFDYRLEAFVPGPKRLHGYYVLPVLEGERLVARVDAKFHRDQGVLRLQNLHWEMTSPVTDSRRRSLRSAAERLAAWLGAEDLEVGERRKK